MSPSSSKPSVSGSSMREVITAFKSVDQSLVPSTVTGLSRSNGPKKVTLQVQPFLGDARRVTVIVWRSAFFRDCKAALTSEAVA